MNPVWVQTRVKRLSLVILLIFVLFTISCATTPNDLMQDSAGFAPGNKRFEGTVNVQFLVILTLPNWPYWVQHPYINRHMLKETVEKEIARNNIFTKVEQGNADYTLDIWVENEAVKVPFMGFGEFTADIASIWRLTRVSDGKVLLCEFVAGHGSIEKPVMAPSQKSMVAAIQNMIQDGLTKLTDQSKASLSAESAAGIRPSIKPWATNVRKNWYRLKAGLTLDEVENIIGPVRTSGAILDYLKFKIEGRRFVLGYDDIAIRKWENLTSNQIAADSHDYQCRTDIFTLVFTDDKLTRWKLHY